MFIQRAGGWCKSVARVTNMVQESDRYSPSGMQGGRGGLIIAYSCVQTTERGNFCEEVLNEGGTAILSALHKS